MSEQDTKVIEIDEDLHRRAKSEAALKGITLRTFVEKAIKESLDEQKRGGSSAQESTDTQTTNVPAPSS